MTTFLTCCCEGEKLFCCVSNREKNNKAHTTQSNKWKNGEKKFSTKWQRRKKPIKVEALEKRWNFC